MPNFIESVQRYSRDRQGEIERRTDELSKNIIYGSDGRSQYEIDVGKYRYK